MDNELLQVIIPVIVAFVMSIPGFMSYFNTRKKDKVEGVAIVKEAEKSEADATGIIVTAATALIDPYIKKVERLEMRDTEREAQIVVLGKRLAAVEKNNYILCDGVRRLIMQIKSMGAVPVFEIDAELCQEMNNVQET